VLPLSESSSVFVRVDESNSSLWRALIMGPQDTPYSAGCFIFDLYFPPNYPSVPPQVKFKTTGGGRIRFNPNLYNDGELNRSKPGTVDVCC
jgi:baculoviral IAP repeat-containing protein 6